MPNFKEAAVIVAGVVLDVEPQQEYQDGKPTGSIKGQKVLIKAGEGDGFAAVTFKNQDFDAVRPFPGSSVALVVRFGAWSRGDNAQNSCAFVRVVTPDDLDRVISSAGLSTAKA